MRDFRKLNASLRSLVVFRDLLNDTVIRRFTDLTACTEDEAFITACAEFEAALFSVGDNWSDYLRHAVLHSENIAVRRRALNQESAVISESLKRELIILNEACLVSLADFDFPSAKLFVAWKNSSADLVKAYEERLKDVAVRGYGMYADYHVFTFRDGELVPVKYPDPQKLSELPGYEAERRRVIANAEALLAGEPAVNMLLYGDAGTGKSSTIKAIANEYRDQGLRLIEVRRNELYEIPALLEQLASLPLKFIVFIDDLSFSSNDDNFAALKAILEGSVSRQASNTIIAATSNRRHLVKESVSDRFLDDMHENDTRQELLSLSARFGLVVTFQKPDRSRYLYIVEELAKEYGIDITPQDLQQKAEAFALRAGGRTPRVARQLIEQLKSGVL